MCERIVSTWIIGGRNHARFLVTTNKRRGLLFNSMEDKEYKRLTDNAIKHYNNTKSNK